MTAEHITLIGATDFKALRVVCGKCRASLSLQLDETINIPSDCPVCAAKWLDARAPATPSAAEALATAVKSYRAAKDHRFTLQFELVQP